MAKRQEPTYPFGIGDHILKITRKGNQFIYRGDPSKVCKNDIKIIFKNNCYRIIEMNNVGWLVVITNRAMNDDAKHVSTDLFRTYKDAIQFVREYIDDLYIVDPDEENRTDIDIDLDLSRKSKEYFDDPKDELDLECETFHIRSLSYNV